jgi:Fe2+ transport system protein B
MNIVNSIVRGFGGQIGRHAANKVLNGKQTKTIRISASLSFWQGIKTILWFFPMMFLSLLINLMFNSGDIHLVSPIKFLLLSLFFTFVIGYGYYQENKNNLK